MPLISRRCDHCEFYVPKLLSASCHRYPPPNLWPAVKADDWCGEFQPRTDQQKAFEAAHEGPPGGAGKKWSEPDHDAS